MIDNSRLAALDDPEVRRLAAKFRNPDGPLSEDGIPVIRGISVAGSYKTLTKESIIG